MTLQKVVNVYLWQVIRVNEPECVDVIISRRGIYGYSEHAYTNVSGASIDRLLYAIPPKPVKIDGNMIVYEIALVE